MKNQINIHSFHCYSVLAFIRLHLVDESQIFGVLRLPTRITNEINSIINWQLFMSSIACVHSYFCVSQYVYHRRSLEKKTLCGKYNLSIVCQ